MTAKLFAKIGVFQDQPILLKLEVYFRTNHNSEREREGGPTIITARNIHDVRLAAPGSEGVITKCNFSRLEATFTRILKLYMDASPE